METTNAYELGWDDEIEDSGQRYEVAPPGDYDFQVLSYERERYQGSGKIPACNRAVLNLELKSPQYRTTMKCYLLLYSTLQWKLCEFFASIGQHKHGEKLRMNWSIVPGASGRCKVGIRKYRNDDGEEREVNEITKFYEPQATPAKKYTPGAF